MLLFLSVSFARFNSRSRGGSDVMTDGVLQWLQSFNSRSRGGSDLSILYHNVYQPLFQFTLPRGERRDDRLRHHQGLQVSIHAPAGGATRPSLPPA